MGSTFEQYRKVYEMLEDEVSRRIYLSRLNYLISGNERYITDMVDTMTMCYPCLANGLWYRNRIVQNLKDSLPADQGIVLYGAGKFASETIGVWGGDARLVGFCSHSKNKQEKGYLGYPVISPEELLARRDLNVVINIVDQKQKCEVLQVLKDGNYPQNQIYTLSLEAWEFEREQYFAQDLISFGENEIFVDAGCYNLENSLEFRRRWGHIKKVYAFEPDPQQYQICLDRKEREAFQEAHLFPYGVWSAKDTLHFCAYKGGASCIGNGGEISVPVVAIDDVVDPRERVTMIKMDIEGSKLEALRGARKTICRDKPRLAVCIYHKAEDMTEVPLYIKELVPEYRLYVRHHSKEIGETVLYAVMP